MRRKLPKLLGLKWVWFEHDPYIRNTVRGKCRKLGMLVLNRWVLSYYKGAVVLWKRQKMVLQDIDFATIYQTKLHLGDYISRTN